MQPRDLALIRKHCPASFVFEAEIMNKAIWGELGEDSASIAVTAQGEAWHLHFIRTQSGDPSPFEDYVCEVIDEYEKQLSDDALYDVLSMHRLLQDFEQAVQAMEQHM